MVQPPQENKMVYISVAPPAPLENAKGRLAQYHVRLLSITFACSVSRSLAQYHVRFYVCYEKLYFYHIK